MSLQNEVIHENRCEDDGAKDDAIGEDCLFIDADGNLNIRSVGGSVQVSSICKHKTKYFIHE